MAAPFFHLHVRFGNLLPPFVVGSPKTTVRLYRLAMPQRPQHEGRACECDSYLFKELPLQKLISHLGMLLGIACKCWSQRLQDLVVIRVTRSDHFHQRIPACVFRQQFHDGLGNAGVAFDNPKLKSGSRYCHVEMLLKKRHYIFKQKGIRN